MDEVLMSSPGSSDPDSPGGLNRGCLFDPDLLTIIVPETPSPRLRKRRRRRCDTEQLITHVTGSGSGRRAERMSSSERVSPSRPKCLRVPLEREEQGAGHQGVRLDSSLRTFPEDACVERAPSSVSCPSSSSPSSSSSSSLTLVSEDTEEVGLMAASSTGAAAPSGELSKRKRKRRKMSLSSSPSLTDTGALSFLTDEERRWLNAEGRARSTTHTQPRTHAAAAVEDQLLISDGDEAMVRAAQMEEDEAFARSLQAEFDQEETQNQRRQNQQRQNQYQQTQYQQTQYQQNQYQQTQYQQTQYQQIQYQQIQYQQTLHQQNQSTREQSPSRFYSAVQPRWMTQVLAAVTPPAGREEESGQRRGRVRSRRRNAMMPDLSDNSQGNDYEALLEFEDRQGAVKSKLTRREIQRFPTKTFVSTNNGGNTQCQICFCDYAAGDKQRMLSCFHDYHVQCIDRWLKDNNTCPICRANMGQPLTID